MAENMVINYGSFEGWAGKIEDNNIELDRDLHDIKDLINSLEGTWESNAAVAIRQKITDMEPRFKQYYNVVANYVTFIRNAARSYSATESTNEKNANKFI